MKIKKIVVACAALSSVAAMGQTTPLNPATATSYLTYYIGGASALAPAVKIIVPALFAAGSNIVTITQSGGNAVTAWYGLSNATYTTTSQPLLVIFNSTNGEFAGLGQLINTTSPSPWSEANVLQIGPSGDALTCQLSTAPYTCTTADSTRDAFQQIELSLSDVYPDEGYPGVINPGVNGNLALNQLVTTTTGLEGYGVAVNPALYQALQAAQGLTVGSLTAANQPNIQSTDYTSLVSESGAIKSAADLLQNSDGTLLTVVERTFDGGTQAASNIYFLNNVCGNVGYGGALSPVSVTDGGTSGLNPGQFNVLQETTTGAVASALVAPTGSTGLVGYAIGVLSLTSVPAQTANSWQYVKLDGISPNWGNGTLDPYQRNAFAAGAYKFATETSASYRKTTSGINLALNKAVVAGLQNSTLHNLVGLAYFDNPSGVYTAGGQQARYNRNGNDCSPLSDTNF